jgi:hypothetical protein
MKYLTEFIQWTNEITGLNEYSFDRGVLVEGGNVFKAPNWTKENPEMLTSRILKENVPATIKFLEKLTGMELRSAMMGSTGIAPSSGDIDLAIDMNSVSKESLVQLLVSKGVQQADIKKTGDSVHYKTPISGSQKGQFVQTDFMFVPDVPFAVWSATVTPGSAYKGMYKQQLMADLTRTVNPQWKWNHFRGVVDRQTNQSVFGFDPDAIAVALLGDGASKKDLESVEGILAALKRQNHKHALDVRNAYRGTLSRDPSGPRIPDEETVTEEVVKPKVGRKYQHIEDLTLSHGSLGALHAVQRLMHMAQTGGSVELKWDGMPVVYWGRDDQGNFSMIPKNAWAYLKSGKTKTNSGAPTLMTSPDDVRAFILGTGGGDPEARQAFADQFANLWPYFEKISPKRGYLEGGLLFYPGTKPDGQSAMPELNRKTATYDFTPNITTFHVPVGSDLGKRISNAKLMVAATGYYSSLGSSDEQRFPDAEKLSVPGIIVQGTTYVQEPTKINLAGLKQTADFVRANAAKIDRYLSPKPGLSNPAAELYTYLNKHLRTQNLAKDFPLWAETNLSAKKAETLLADQEGMIATLNTVEMLTKQKNQVIEYLSSGTHGGIKQTKPEGYAQAHPGADFEHDIPDQFIKMIDQTNWKPRESAINELKRMPVSENKMSSDTAVVGWGRGMGHKGHMYLASAVITTAEEIGADPYFILSKTVGPDDPLLPDEKLEIYKKVFPDRKDIFTVATTDAPTLPAMLQKLKDTGYRNVIVVVGADQKQAFQFLANPTKKTGKLPVEFDSIKVISRQETNDPYRDQEGPRATPMREILKNTSATYDQKLNVWQDAMPDALTDEEVKKFMRLAAERMGVPLDKQVDEADNPLYFGGGSQSAIPGTPSDLKPRPSQEEMEQFHKEMADLKRFMGR